MEGGVGCEGVGGQPETTLKQHSEPHRDISGAQGKACNDFDAGPRITALPKLPHAKRCKNVIKFLGLF